MKKPDHELTLSRKVELSSGGLSGWRDEADVLDYGMIAICRRGGATFRVNFDVHPLHVGSVIILFPNDVVSLEDVAEGFEVEYLRYDASILREASLQLEQTVYYQLRQDRCRTESPTITQIIDTMFSLLRIYFVQSDCKCLEQFTLLQLKAFFLGYYDYLTRFPEERTQRQGSRRVQELFDRFMASLEVCYKESRDVGFFAAQLHITPKYLNTIVSRMTAHNAKTVIDHYTVLQLKLALRSSPKSVKEIAWEHNFSDLAFFCRYFKQHTGQTPQQFRKSAP